MEKLWGANLYSVHGEDPRHHQSMLPDWSVPPSWCSRLYLQVYLRTLCPWDAEEGKERRRWRVWDQRRDFEEQGLLDVRPKKDALWGYKSKISVARKLKECFKDSVMTTPHKEDQSYKNWEIVIVLRRKGWWPNQSGPLRMGGGEA